MGVRCWDYIIILSSIQVTRAKGGARAPKAPPLATLLDGMLIMLTWLLPLFTDPTLTLNNFIGVMKKVTSDKKKRREVWGEVLKWKYRTPYSYLDEVDTNYTTEKEKTNVLADVYINSRPESSWEHLVNALYDAGELAAAKEPKPFLQQNGE